ncbi:hypothetical protein K439DRAFT_1622571 [Ramaria rubella]|nr:hypothetical protein K439DRAFT_1622571 [Ramaria rubella]
MLWLMKIHDGSSDPSPREASDIAKARTKLHQDIEKWQKYQLTHFSAFHPLVTEMRYQTPEEDLLLLPSDFSAHQCAQLGLTNLAECERQLREGEANDALEHVQLAIKKHGINYGYKRKQIHGQRDNTRAQCILNASLAETNRHASKYHAACVALGMAADDSTYQPLDDSDLWMRSLAKGHELGDGTRQEPWIWTTGVSGACGLENREEWENDGEYYRFSFTLFLTTEEVDILDAEFKRTYLSFSCMCDVWSQLAAECDDSAMGVGRKAYVYQQAAMYRAMVAHFQNQFEEA